MHYLVYSLALHLHWLVFFSFHKLVFYILLDCYSLPFSYSSFNALKVIEHRPYNHKADVFSFGIVLWELLTGEVSLFFIFLGSFLFLSSVSFSIVMMHKHKSSNHYVKWLMCQLPYSFLTPLQAAVGVVQKVFRSFHVNTNYRKFLFSEWVTNFNSHDEQGLRPTIPKHTHPKLAGLLERCWLQDPTLRPDFSTILEILQQLAKEVWYRFTLKLVCIKQFH